MNIYTQSPPRRIIIRETQIINKIISIMRNDMPSFQEIRQMKYFSPIKNMNLSDSQIYQRKQSHVFLETQKISYIDKEKQIKPRVGIKLFSNNRQNQALDRNQKQPQKEIQPQVNSHYQQKLNQKCTPINVQQKFNNLIHNKLIITALYDL